MLHDLFLRHPHALGETYAQHQRHALGFAAELLLAALACFVHALVPGLYDRSASRRVARLQARMAPRSAVAGGGALAPS